MMSPAFLPFAPHGRSSRSDSIPARCVLTALSLAVLAAGSSAHAQEVPTDRLPVTGGVVEAGLHLRQATGVRRVLVIGAHPDDEDTALLAELDRHRGVRAAYLSLTRGEGGQNLIGPELGKGLGLIRTGELMAARRLDGAEQFFSRAYDFGYSKTADETFRHWPRDTLLSDVVWVLRVFRPHVVVSVFSGTENDGHGQHQVAGMLAREAFDAAADPRRFPEHMEWGARPWRPLKLYRRAWRDPGSTTLRIATGEYDPLLGRSSFQLAMESRSQHRSQDFGVAQPPGPRYTRLLLLEDRTGSADDDPGSPSLFSGIDTSLVSLAAELPADRRRRFRETVRRYLRRVESARGALTVLDPSAAAPALTEALEAIREAESIASPPAGTRDSKTRAGPAGERVDMVLARKLSHVERALMAARGLRVRLRAARERWVSGQTVRIHTELWNGGEDEVAAGPPELDLRSGWSARLLPADSVPKTASELSRFYGSEPPVEGGADTVTLSPGTLARWTFELRVPDDAEPTEPYFLARDTVGDLYRWPADGDVRARPMGPPPATGRVPLTLAGSEGRISVVASSEVRYRGVDKAMGEFWRPVRVSPRASVDVSPRVLVWPTGGASEAGSGMKATEPEVTASVRSLGPDGLHARLSLVGDSALEIRPGQGRLELPEGVESGAVTFRLSESGGSGGEPAFRSYRLGARAEPAARTPSVAAGGGLGWERSLTVVDYPHIDPVPYYEDATVRIERFPVSVDRDRRVGYVMGSGDEVPGAIRQLGLSVEMLGPERVRAGEFGDLDVIVLGVRAYEVRQDLRGANDRLLEWVRAGGTLIVQYNKYEFEEGGFAPFEVSMDRPHDRVTDERSPVALLHPDAPLLSSPNRIGQRDFQGWIQERGLYFLHSWPERVVPLLAMEDPGEDPKRGSLLVASVGEGVYVYTGLAFFRQLPAGVPGAYRLFANLLSLEPGEWRSWVEGTRGP